LKRLTNTGRVIKHIAIHETKVDDLIYLHLLTSTSWWSSQKRVPHNRTHNNKSRV